MGEPTEARVREIIINELGVESEKVTNDASFVEDLGADYVAIHCAIDEQMEGKDPFDILRQVAKSLSIPVGVAGGINSETAAMAVDHAKVTRCRRANFRAR